MDTLTYIDEYLKDSLKNIITKSVDDEIEKRVKEFQRQLVDRKDQYISEIMKGIRVFHNQDISGSHTMNYKIIFENVTRIEKE